jgi:NAD(P)-dependent dehydrogenase (short-subunit alcohol dehydrogenase family)
MVNNTHSGIGAAVAKGFARSGCTRIAITDINSETLSRTREAILSINPSAKILDRPGDIADESFIDKFHDEIFSKFSRLDYAVNCAGVLGSKTLKAVEMETDAFDRLNGINYRTWIEYKERTLLT